MSERGDSDVEDDFGAGDSQNEDQVVSSHTSHMLILTSLRKSWTRKKRTWMMLTK